MSFDRFVETEQNQWAPVPLLAAFKLSSDSLPTFSLLWHASSYDCPSADQTVPILLAQLNQRFKPTSEDWETDSVFLPAFEDYFECIQPRPYSCFAFL